MKINTKSLRAGALVLVGVVLLGSAHASPDAATVVVYSTDGRLTIPENYREWIFLSSGFDMSYNPELRAGHHMFDNVFVNPEAYRDFLRTGTWPDHTVLIVEGREGQNKGSINRAGLFQSTEVIVREVHIKDKSRFEGGWAFFLLDTKLSGVMLPHTAECYSCHAAHALVDTTFVQFYPTLLPVAAAHGTLSVDHAADR